MADPLSVTASVLAIVTVAVQSVKSLNDTVSRFKGRDKTLQRLQKELDAISAILDSLEEALRAESSISALLKEPVGRCSEVCEEFRRSMLSFSERSKTGILDWAKLEFMRGNINEFIDTLSAYKSTITVGLGIITLRTATVSQKALKDYNEMIQDTMYELKVHLQRVDEKLANFPASSPSTSGVDLTNEKEVTKQCLRICEDAKQYLESTRKSSVLEVPAPGASTSRHHDTFEAQLLARQALDQHADGFTNIIGQIRSRLESLVSENNPNDHEERSRLLNDISASKQCLEICKVASEVSSQKIFKIGEVVAVGNGGQVVANTLADLFDIKKAVSKDNSAQLLMSATGEDLRVLTEKHYENRSRTFAPEPSPVSRPYGAGSTQAGSQPVPRQTNVAAQSQQAPRREKASPNEIRKRTDWEG